MIRNLLKSTRVRFVASVVIIAALIWLVVGGIDGAIHLYRLRTGVSAMEAELVRVNATVDSLQGEIRRLKSDTTHIERIARERLGMAGKNELIYKFVKEKQGR